MVTFHLPEAVGGTRWVRLIDTNRGENDDLEDLDFGHAYQVTGRSLLLFILKPTPSRGQETDAERSYQHVMQAFEEASSRPMALPSGTVLEELLDQSSLR